MLWQGGMWCSHNTNAQQLQSPVLVTGRGGAMRLTRLTPCDACWACSLSASPAGDLSTKDLPQVHLIGGILTAADIALYHWLAAVEHHMPGAYAAAIQGAPLCAALAAQVAARSRIAAYLASSRCQPWDRDSLM